MRNKIIYYVVDEDCDHIPVADKVYSETLDKSFYHRNALLPLLKEDIPVHGGEEGLTVGNLLKLMEGDDVPTYNYFKV